MNRKKLSFALFLVAIIVGFFLTNQRAVQLRNSHSKHLRKKEVQLPKEHKTGTEQACQSAYAKLEKATSTSRGSLRFLNKHFEYEGEIYRTRFFFDDGQEGDIPTYLVYKEDKDSFPTVIETSKYEPGQKFKFFENKIKKYLYTESGLIQNLEKEDDLFTHYENDRLIEVISTNLNCKY